MDNLDIQYIETSILSNMMKNILYDIRKKHNKNQHIGCIIYVINNLNKFIATSFARLVAFSFYEKFTSKSIHII